MIRSGVRDADQESVATRQKCHPAPSNFDAGRGAEPLAAHRAASGKNNFITVSSIVKLTKEVPLSKTIVLAAATLAV